MPLARTRRTGSPYARASVLTCLGFLAWLFLPGRSDVARHLVSDVAFVLAPGTATWRCARAARRGGEWAPTWWLMAGAVGAWCLGSVYWGLEELSLPAAPPFPSPADVGWLLFPLFAVAALVVVPGMPRRATPAARLLLDALASAAALLTAAWIGPLGEEASSMRTDLAHAAAITYPALDLLAVAVVVVVLDRLRGRFRQPAVIAAFGVLLACATDSTYSLLSAHNNYVVGDPLDGVWVIAFLLIGLAVERPTSQPAEPRGSQRHLLPTVPALAGIAIVLLSGRLSHGLDTMLLVDVVVLGLALTARQQLLMAENRALRISLEARVVVRTAELREAREVFRRRAYTDPLTGLANRDAFSEALAAAGGSGHVAVVLLDLDGFKQVNDGFGHVAGDEVLVAVADRLRRCLRRAAEGSYDIARLGGDEFACLLRDLADPRDADAIAARLVESMRESVVIGGREFFLSSSAGVSVVAAPVGTAPEELLREADTAMYAAKEAGGNRSLTFDAGMHRRVVERIALEADLHRALAEGEIYVHYQPVYSLAQGRVTGVEALARWRHPQRGQVAPMDFIPVAERTGLIVELERQVLDQVCRQMVRWRQLVPDLRVGVNFSARHLREPDVALSILSCLARHELAASSLVAEVTESLFFADEEAVTGVLSALVDTGIVLALDDFGTGYSSLSRLSKHPFRILKVDRTFLAEVVEGGRPPAILLATLAMARGLGLDVVAEGVETAAQLAFLGEQGCGFAQGYLLARPGPAEQVEHLLLAPMVQPV